MKQGMYLWDQQVVGFISEGQSGPLLPSLSWFYYCKPTGFKAARLGEGTEHAP